MRGLTVACPHCEARLHIDPQDVGVLTPAGGATKMRPIPPPLVAEEDMPEIARPERRTGIAAETFQLTRPNATMAELEEAAAARTTGAREAEAPPELMPPKYRIPAADAATRSGRHGDPPRIWIPRGDGTYCEVDPHVTHIVRRGRSVEIRTLSREQRVRRRLRGWAVYLLCLLVIVLVVWWLRR
jgi:hypothetical protein